MLQLNDFEIVINKNCPHIKIEYRYVDKSNMYCIYLFDEGFIGLHFFIKQNDQYIEINNTLVNSLTEAIENINNYIKWTNIELKAC